jgi:hypothetical protein
LSYCLFQLLVLDIYLPKAFIAKLVLNSDRFFVLCLTKKAFFSLYLRASNAVFFITHISFKLFVEDPFMRHRYRYQGDSNECSQPSDLE